MSSLMTREERGQIRTEMSRHRAATPVRTHTPTELERLAGGVCEELAGCREAKAAWWEYVLWLSGAIVLGAIVLGALVLDALGGW